jgi:hypothetical protein
MFGLSKPKLPITDEQRLWVDGCFLRLSNLLGPRRMLYASVMLPTSEHFPDSYDGSDEALQTMFRRVAEQMQVDPASIDLQLFADSAFATRSLIPYSSGDTRGAGGLYSHDPSSRAQIAINEAQLKDPLSLVATLAHELGHVILLRPGLVDRNAEDMEPMNDLLTVFLGFGVFNANAAFQFRQYTNNDSQGWSTRRLGYLSEELFGYALARFAFERKEENPEWAKYLTTNVSTYFKRSLGWLRMNGSPVGFIDRGD